jgi:hypothetical protein
MAMVVLTIAARHAQELTATQVETPLGAANGV